MANKDSDTSRLESLLAYGFVGSVAASVLAVIVILLAAFGNNAWVPVGLGLVPMLALPFGFLCLTGVLILSSRRKRRSSK